VSDQRRQPGVGTILCVRQRTTAAHQEDGGNGARLQPGAEIAPREWQDVSEHGRTSGSVRRIESPVIGDPTGRSGAPRPDRPPSKVAPIALGPLA
jgi:hypothetical protein